ncbi:MAG: hypothetical protein KDA22_03505, partial [Phycisphaerales bacterium]|nr:hypothetical protein [Phycisphaerales bacterium]
VEGSFGRAERVLVRHGIWTLVLDTFFSAATKMTHTRVRAPFVRTDGFRFTIYRRGMFSELAKVFGMQDVEVGPANFDLWFIVKGTDEGKLRDLCADARLRDLLFVVPNVHLSIECGTEAFETSPSANTDELTLVVPGAIGEAECLRGMFDLMARALDRMTSIGSAAGTAPEPARCPYCKHQLLAQTVCPECGRPVTAPDGGTG